MLRSREAGTLRKDDLGLNVTLAGWIARDRKSTRLNSSH